MLTVQVAVELLSIPKMVEAAGHRRCLVAEGGCLNQLEEEEEVIVVAGLPLAAGNTESKRHNPGNHHTQHTDLRQVDLHSIERIERRSR